MSTYRLDIVTGRGKIHSKWGLRRRIGRLLEMRCLVWYVLYVSGWHAHGSKNVTCNPEGVGGWDGGRYDIRERTTKIKCEDTDK